MLLLLLLSTLAIGSEVGPFYGSYVESYKVINAKKELLRSRWVATHTHTQKRRPLHPPPCCQDAAGDMPKSETTALWQNRED